MHAVACLAPGSNFKIQRPDFKMAEEVSKINGSLQYFGILGIFQVID